MHLYPSWSTWVNSRQIVSSATITWFAASLTSLSSIELIWDMVSSILLAQIRHLTHQPLKGKALSSVLVKVQSESSTIVSARDLALTLEVFTIKRSGVIRVRNSGKCRRRAQLIGRKLMSSNHSPVPRCLHNHNLIGTRWATHHRDLWLIDKEAITIEVNITTLDINTEVQYLKVRVATSWTSVIQEVKARLRIPSRCPAHTRVEIRTVASCSSLPQALIRAQISTTWPP